MSEPQLYWAWDRKQPYNKDGSRRYVEMVDASEYDALRDEVARLTAFVKKVGHPQWCPGFMTNNSDACTCGYYAIIPPAKAALTQGKGGVNG